MVMKSIAAPSRFPTHHTHCVLENAVIPTPPC